MDAAAATAAQPTSHLIPGCLNRCQLTDALPHMRALCSTAACTSRCNGALHPDQTERQICQSAKFVESSSGRDRVHAQQLCAQTRCPNCSGQSSTLPVAGHDANHTVCSLTVRLKDFLEHASSQWALWVVSHACCTSSAGLPFQNVREPCRSERAVTARPTI